MTGGKNNATGLPWNRVLAVAASGWAVALGFATVVASWPAPGPFAYAISACIYAVGALVCHQRPERSFQFWGAQLPVCARCTGLYLGAALAACLAASAVGAPGAAVSARRARFIVCVAATPTVLTLIFEWVSAQTPSHWIRAATGGALGAAAAWVVAALDAPRASVEVH